MQHHIDQLTGHHIVCGLGDTGRHAVAELQKTNTPHVVVDLSEENLKKLKQLHPEALGEMLFVVGDATEEDVLEKAGLSRAKGLSAALPLDQDTLVVTVSVRQRHIPAALTGAAQHPIEIQSRIVDHRRQPLALAQRRDTAQYVSGGAFGGAQVF